MNTNRGQSGNALDRSALSAEEINVYAMPIDTKIGNEFVVMWETQRADQSSAFTD